jgi:hypothetical protein
LAGSTSKKIVAVRFDREPIHGFIDPQGYLQETGIEILTSEGAVVTLPYSEVKAVCFVRDFSGGPVWPENRMFSNRPKTEGLWVRLEFRDGDTLEGILPNNLLAVDPPGLAITPPDAGFHNQRVFVPRTALLSVKVLGVVNSPLRRATKKKPSKDQLKMFE